MFTSTALLKDLFKGFTVLRWNDKLRPVEFIEMDKHAHKMMIAWCIGKYEEKMNNKVEWYNIIRGGVYELLRRIIIRDIKNPIFFKIQTEYKDVYRRLNQWVFEYFQKKIDDEVLLKELESFIVNEDLIDPLSQKILGAAHKYASYLEFLLIKQVNPQGYQIEEIERAMLNDLQEYLNFEAVRKMITKQKVADFVELYGQLRFQIRWSQTPRIPRTSVLGHSMFVACVSYLLARDNNACPKRIYNDFFGGLFHDLPETLTRDIISPVKTSSDLFEEIIHEIEQMLAEDEIYPLLEYPEWKDEIRFFTQNEFTNKIIIDNLIHQTDISVEEINLKYNSDEYNPYDGVLVRAADEISAFLEAKSSIDYGIRAEDLNDAIEKIPKKYQKTIGNINFAKLMEELNGRND